MTAQEGTKLLKKQLSIGTYIQNYIINSIEKKGRDKLTAAYLRARIETLENYWSDFQARHDLLEEFEEELKEELYFKQDQYLLCEDLYCAAKGVLMEHLGKLQKDSPDDPRATQGSILQSHQILRASTEFHALPTIEVPKFSGEQKDWESFKERFSSVVKDKTSLPDVIKLQHLLNSVEGNAERMLKGTKVSAANLEVTWEKLCRRYDNQRLLLANHLDELISLKSVLESNAAALNELLDKAEGALQALVDLQYPTDHWDCGLVHCVVRKLDLRTRKSWEKNQANVQGFSTFQALTKFLEAEMRQLNTAEAVCSSEPKSIKEKGKTSKLNSVSAHVTNASSKSKSPPKCPCCSKAHFLFECDKFESLQIDKRFEVCRESKICMNCLRPGHFAPRCFLKTRCKICKGKHHVKLHRQSTASVNATFESSDESSGPAPLTSDSDSNVVVGRARLLETAQVILRSPSGESTTVRALIDPAAERSFIEDRVVKQLALPYRKVSMSISSVGAKSHLISRAEISLNLRSKIDPQFSCTISALVLNELTRVLPSKPIAWSDWVHLKNLQLADLQFSTLQKVDCILSADVYGDILREGVVRGPPDSPIAQLTVFGRILTGNTGKGNSSGKGDSLQSFHVAVEPSLSQALSKFWEIKEASKERILTPEESFCEDFFMSTVSRSPEGRVIVRLPFAQKMESPSFSDSRHIAVSCLLRSEKRRSRNIGLNEAYSKFMDDYEQLRHMKSIEHWDDDRPSFYMPHHAVFRDDEKIRVVFNASQNGGNGLSLNDILLSGPKLQIDITTVLTRWRFFRFAFTADIVKMFRQILVHLNDGLAKGCLEKARLRKNH